ncbi:preATP grasp domain-containing protein [Streptomyces sp. NPDC001966]
MARLWLGNSRTEHMIDRIDLLREESRVNNSLVAMRLVWLLGDGDVVVLPQPATSTFMEYVAHHTGVDPESIHVISPDSDILTQDFLHSEDVLQQIRKLIGPDWEFCPYIYDRGAAIFAQELGLAPDRGQSFMGQGGAELFNSKVIFRAFASAIGAPIPDGMPCMTTHDLSRTLERLLENTDSVIVKRDRAVGGNGNYVVTTDPALAALGAFSAIHIESSKTLDEAIAAAGLTATHAPLGEVVVEEFHPDCISVYAEFLCDRTDDAPRMLSSGKLRMAEDPPVLEGFEIPLAGVPEGSQETFLGEAARMAHAIQKIGYVGLVNIDAVISSNGDVWFNEVNARIGGSTHLSRIPEKLVGPDWTATHILMSGTISSAPPIRTLTEQLSDNQLSWNAERQEGIVVVSAGAETGGKAEYIVLAAGWKEARDLEVTMQGLLARNGFR